MSSILFHSTRMLISHGCKIHPKHLFFQQNNLVLYSKLIRSHPSNNCNFFSIKPSTLFPFIPLNSSSLFPSSNSKFHFNETSLIRERSFNSDLLISQSLPNNSNSCNDESQSNSNQKKPWKRFFSNFLKAFAAFIISLSFLFVSFPYLISNNGFRTSALSFYNRTIPGSVSVAEMDLGWTKPVKIKNMKLKDENDNTLIFVSSFNTQYDLFSILIGKDGFGKCTVTDADVDLLEDTSSGFSKIDLALNSAETLLSRQKKTNKGFRNLPQTNNGLTDVRTVDFTATLDSPSGHFHLENVRLRLNDAIAQLVGNKLVAEIKLGKYASERDDEFQSLANDRKGQTPVFFSLWSDVFHAESAGTILSFPFHPKIRLIRPILTEMAITPAVGKYILAKINPLLMNVISPSMKEEDMPDITMYIHPHHDILPFQSCNIKIEPMKLVAGRSDLIDGALSLVGVSSRIGQKLDLQTSLVEADVALDEKVNCKRMDLLIGDGIHLAAWGEMNLNNEKMQLTLAICKNTLKRYLQISNLPSNYCLQVPIRGFIDKPRVDWKQASFNISQLVIQARTGLPIINVDRGYAVPPPLARLPWEA